jgi:hypothetical protein
MSGENSFTSFDRAESPADLSRKPLHKAIRLTREPRTTAACYPSGMTHRRFRLASAAVLGLAALAAAAGTGLLADRVERVARSVEQVRGRRFERQVPASEIEGPELKRVLRAKLLEGFPASQDDTIRTLAALGFFDDAPNLVDRLVDFYSSQVIAFYDPQPRRFFLVRGGAAASLPGGGDSELGSDAGERMIFAHELTHALQDETLRLDKRIRDLKENGDRALALQSLLEGEATLVMVRVVLADLPGAQSAEVEDSLAPLLSAGALERSNIPKDLPDYFVDQLFFPYVEGTAYVRRLVKTQGWAGIDRLWKNPPASTSEILHEGAPFAPAENLIDSAAARRGPDGYHPLYADTVGEWGVRFLLRRAMEPNQADAIAAGWRGDRVAFFGSGRGIAYLWKLRFDTPLSAERFESAWKTSRKRGETVVRGGRDVTITKGFSAAAADRSRSDERTVNRAG